MIVGRNSHILHSLVVFLDPTVLQVLIPYSLYQVRLVGKMQKRFQRGTMLRTLKEIGIMMIMVFGTMTLLLWLKERIRS